VPTHLQQHETLYWIARLGTFRAAASQLGISQPTVSLRIREWERELGLHLFKRMGRTAILSEDGKMVLEYSERILGLAHDLDRRIGGHNELRGLVRLGLPDTFAHTCLAGILRELESRYPDISLAVTVDHTRVLMGRLEEGALDLAVINEPVAVRGMKSELLIRHQLIWIASPKIAVQRRRWLPRHLIEQRVLCCPAPSNSFTLIMDWFEQHHLVPPRVCYCTSTAAILEVVAAGCGITAVPRSLARSRLERKMLVELNTGAGFPVQRFYTLSRKTSTNPAIAAVARATRTAVEAVK
jgi:DNA-binding transcriptional LysR family regulator